MAKLEKIKPGQILFYAYPRDRSVYWPVRIISVDLEQRTAVVIWNGNDTRPDIYDERQIRKLQYKEPRL